MSNRGGRSGGGAGGRGGGRASAGYGGRGSAGQPFGGRGGGASGRGSYAQGTVAAVASTLQTWDEVGAGAGDPAALSKAVAQLKLAPSSSRAIEPPPRPGYGKIGRRCVVRANHFLFQLSSTKNIHHYDVSITSETPSKESTSKEITFKKLCKRVMCELIRLYKQFHLGNRIPAYDGNKSLYTAGPLPFESNQFVVPLLDDAGPVAQRRERRYRVAIKLAAIIGSPGRPADITQDVIRALDVVMRAAAPPAYVPIGRSFFSTQLGRGELGEGIEYWKGYYQSVRPVQMGFSLNVDASARAFYKPVLLPEFVAEFLKRRDLTRPLTDQDRRKVNGVLRELLVETCYLGYTKCYKINSLSPERADQLMFTADTGPISVCGYFLKKYHIQLHYPFLPCIKVGTDRRPVYIPMELCKLVEARRYMKKLSKDQVARMLKATCERPPARERSIIKMVKDNRDSVSHLVAKEFGIQVSEEPTLINARILPVPMLNYSNKELVTPELGQWRMNDKRFYSGATVKYWTCLNFSTLSQADVTWFCKDVVSMCVSKGMDFSTPVVPIRNASSNLIDRALREVHNEAKKQLQLLLVILPSSEGAHETIKRICETELGIISQCCDLEKEMKNKRQYLENLSFKINVKTGGRNVALHAAVERRIPLLTAEGEDAPTTIIFGADVTHAKPNDATPSVAAVVASMDWPEVSKYRALISEQGVREEIIQDLYPEEIHPEKGRRSCGMIEELLFAFYRSTGRKPARIIFYRDGVSEGQFAQVLLHEVLAIRKACQSLDEGYAPRLTFVVVQKRHHTRFFPNDANMADRSGNILPGTVVDTTICHPIQYDFYLCSHSGIQGTSRPTHYHVLLDENYFPPDLLHLLTYSLCYTYARCTRSVSLVPPVYYAHLAAFRARSYIEVESSDGGSMRRGQTSTEARRPLPKIIDKLKDFMFYC